MIQTLAFGDEIALMGTSKAGARGFLSPHGLVPVRDEAASFQDCVVIVLPALHNEAAMRAKEAREGTSAGVLEANEAIEREENDKVLAAKLGQPISFGQVVSLKHVRSGAFLSVNVGVTASERGCLKIDFEDTFPLDEAKWILLPRFKVKREGDAVTSSDQLIIVNRRYHLSLHIGSVPVGPFCDFCEVNASASEARETTWSAHIYNRFETSVNLPQGRLCAGQEIQLREKDRDLFICKTREGTDVIRAVPSSKQPVCMDSNSFWLVERADNVRTGGPINYGQEVFVRHLASGAHLMSEASGGACRFSFAPLGPPGDDGPVAGCLMQVLIAESGHVVALTDAGDKVYRCEERDSVRSALALSVSSDPDVRYIRAIREALSVLHQLAKSPLVFEANVASATRALSDVAMWCSQNRQENVFREQGGLYVLIELLGFLSQHRNMPKFQPVLLLVLELVPIVFRSSSMDDLVRQVIVLLQELVTFDESSEVRHALLKLLEENDYVTRMSPEEVETFLKMLETFPRMSDVLRLLACLCTFGTKAVPRTQVMIAERLCGSTQLFPIFVVEELKRPTAAVVVSGRKVNLDELEGTDVMNEYVAACVALASRLTFGRNDESAALLCRVLSFAFVEAALKSDRVAFAIKSACASYLANAFLDVTPFHDVSSNDFIHVWDELPSSPRDVPVVISSTMALCSSILGANNVFASVDYGRLLFAVTNTAKLLIRFGFMTDDAITVFGGLLSKLLDESCAFLSSGDVVEDIRDQLIEWMVLACDVILRVLSARRIVRLRLLLKGVYSDETAEAVVPAVLKTCVFETDSYLEMVLSLLQLRVRRLSALATDMLVLCTNDRFSMLHTFRQVQMISSKGVADMFAVVSADVQHGVIDPAMVNKWLLFYKDPSLNQKECRKLFNALALHEVVLKQVSSGDASKEFVDAALKFLVRHVKGNEAAQVALFSWWDFLLTLAPRSSELLGAVVADNKSTLGSITDVQLDAICSIIDETRSVGMVKVLNTLTVVQGIPFRRHQIGILRHVLGHYDGMIVWGVAGQGLYGKERSAEVEFACAILDLLVGCCAGRIDETEAKAQLILPLKDLIALLTSDAVCESLKVSLTRFLLEVYVVVEKGSLGDDLSFLAVLDYFFSELVRFRNTAAPSAALKLYAAEILEYLCKFFALRCEALFVECTHTIAIELMAWVEKGIWVDEKVVVKVLRSIKVGALPLAVKLGARWSRRSSGAPRGSLKLSRTVEVESFLEDYDGRHVGASVSAEKNLSLSRVGSVGVKKKEADVGSVDKKIDKFNKALKKALNVKGEMKQFGVQLGRMLSLYTSMNDDGDDYVLPEVVDVMGTYPTAPWIVALFVHGVRRLIKDGEVDPSLNVLPRLVRAGAVELMLRLVLRADTHEKSIKFGIGILKGGCEVAQENILSFFKRQPTYIKNFRRSMLRAFDKIKDLTVSVHAIDAKAVRDQVEYCRRMCRLLQLFCEGHYTPMQRFFVEQGGLSKSYNLIQDLVGAADDLTRSVSVDTLPVVLQLWVTLTEAVQGPCRDVQTFLITKSRVFEIANWVFSSAFEPELRSQLHFRVSELLLSLLEQQNDNHLVDHMKRILNGEVIRDCLVDLSKKVDPDENQRNCRINLSCLLLSLQRNKVDQVVAQITDNTIGSVEILRNDMVERVFFPFPPMKMSKSQKLNMLNSVVEDEAATQSQRLSSLVESSERFIKSFRSNEWVKSNRYMGMYVKNVALLQTLLFVFAFVINGMILLSLNSGFLFFLLCLIQTVLSFLRTAGSIALSWTTLIGPHLEGLELSRSRLGFLAFRLLCRDTVHLYLMFHAFCGLFGLLMFATRVGTFLFAVHLFDLVLVNETLHIVLRSITHNSKQLVVTSLFACIVVYVYAIIGFVVFQKDFRSEAGEALCTTLPQCFILMLYEGLRNGGGIGDILTKPVFEDYFFVVRVIYDSSFWIICILILLNSFLGIIVDTFGELRQRKQNADADFRSKCFICGCERGSFEAEVGGFEKHTKTDHNLWNYVYFFAHLRMNKDESDFTGAESFVADSIAAKSVDFFPIGRSLALQK